MPDYSRRNCLQVFLKEYSGLYDRIGVSGSDTDDLRALYLSRKYSSYRLGNFSNAFAVYLILLRLSQRCS